MQKVWNASFFYFSTKGFNSSDIVAHWTLDGTDFDVKWVECFLTFSPSTENIDVICNTYVYVSTYTSLYKMIWSLVHNQNWI